MTTIRIVNMAFRMSEITTLSRNGQGTIPRDVHERLGLQAGVKIARSLLDIGTFVVRLKTRSTRCFCRNDCGHRHQRTRRASASGQRLLRTLWALLQTEWILQPLHGPLGFDDGSRHRDARDARHRVQKRADG